MNNQSRAMAFIDFENINIAARTIHKVKHLDFSKLRQVLSKDLRCVGCVIYLPHKMRELVRVAQNAGLKVEIVTPGKSIDGRLIFDLLINAQKDNFDTAVIASGDRDYLSVIEEVKRMNKRVLIASFPGSLASSMKAAADKVINLDEYITEISQKMYNYTCLNCKNKFELPFKLFPNQIPTCRDCRKQKK